MILRKTCPHESTIQLEEVFRAPREKVFKAWTTPESLKKWFLAEEGVAVEDVEINLYIKGSYFIQVRYPGFDSTSIKGKFLQVNTTQYLEYTWLTPALKGKITTVEVSFEVLDQGSKLFLSHGEFANKDEMNLHIKGWKECIKHLHGFLQR